MKLVVLVEDFYPNISGGAHVRWRFAQIVAERSHEIIVYTPRREGTPRQEVVDDVEIRRPFRAEPSGLPAYLPLAFLFRLRFAVRLALHLLFFVSFDEVDGIHSASNTLHWVGKVVSDYHHIPLVCFVGYTPSLDPEVTLSPKLILERFTFRYCLGAVTLCRSPKIRELIASRSETDVQIVHGILNEEEIQKAANGLNQEAIRREHGVTDSGHLFTFVGRLTPIKNPAGAVDVLADLPAENQLLIIGSGQETEHLREMIDSRGLERRVELLGELPHQTTLKKMAAADGLLVTSKVESYSAVALEALTLGTHVFARPVGVLPELKHERLHLAEISDFPNLINSTTLTANSELDWELLQRFSMSRYTDHILDSFTG